MLILLFVNTVCAMKVLIFFSPYTSQYYISEVPKCCIGWSDFHNFLLITKYIATTISYVKNYDR